MLDGAREFPFYNINIESIRQPNMKYHFNKLEDAKREGKLINIEEVDTLKKKKKKDQGHGHNSFILLFC